MLGSRTPDYRQAFGAAASGESTARRRILALRLASTVFDLFFGSPTAELKTQARDGPNEELLQNKSKEPNLHQLGFRSLTTSFDLLPDEFSVFSKWLPGMDSNHD